ncbi:hypothetical protein EI94DRAFT_1744287 [Lactarius quietus]|nr:hypothetical protein EI94DRAFT_1744287 [Lactarius quietus]
MLFHGPLISLAAAIALTRRATASAILVRRGSSFNCNPNSNSSNATCCDTTTNFNQLSQNDQSVINSTFFPFLNTTLDVGLNCTFPGAQESCLNKALCCYSMILVKDGFIKDLANIDVNCIEQGTAV